MKQSIHWLALIGATASLLGASVRVVAEDQAVGPQNTSVAKEDFAHLWYVSQTTGSDSQGDGSQANPWKSLDKGLAASAGASAKKRATILVAAGTYFPAELKMVEHVDLYGGFDPVEWARDIFQHPTILQAVDQQRMLVGANDARLDGFILRGARVRGEGAALNCVGTSPVVSNNCFQDNQTRTPTNWQPKNIHEKAHDGGAICVSGGAEPRILNNLFVENHTETGRGAAVALYDRCAGIVRNNVFLRNISGAADEHRSSDGGALSIFNWCRTRVEQNLFIENRALGVNDGGAVFVALWSSPVLLGNTFVGNQSTDDGGALFLGGQEHRYGRDQDPLPEPKDFHVTLIGNLFCGNANPNQNSGAMRITMQARAKLVNNILAEWDHLCIQASEAELTNNTFLEDVMLIEFTPLLAPQLIANNIMWSHVEYEGKTPITTSIVRDGFPGDGNLSEDPLLERDRERLSVVSGSFDPAKYLTALQFGGRDWEEDALVGRVVESNKCWSVIHSNDANQLFVWGDLSQVVELDLLPTYRLQPQSPCIDRGAAQFAPPQDFEGDPRPIGEGVDIGADEFNPSSRN